MKNNLRPIAFTLLLQIYNQSWISGKFHDNWREVIILPIFKKGKIKTGISIYRPNNLLSCFGKVMERTIHTRLMQHLEVNHLLENIQSAFRKNLYTEDQIAYLAQNIENAFQDKKKTLAVLVDLTKVFDKVWKKGLLFRLLNNRVEGRMFNWIKDYISFRSARVKIDGILDHKVYISHGVPNGGVLSPIFFLIYINDIIN
jgi:hypothetical protein